ncbi:MAG: 4-hydroxy-3-methylbut-2-enyl diphosphate reductase [Acidobacteriota bacterium]|nr:4-hydroxy-3-methylbut-2-enyl diphosphate reductase [Acidobacteriota bacterium]
MIEKIILAVPRGFCAGVVRAVDIVELALDLYDEPVYVRKEIVHNSHVVKDLSNKGAIFVDRIEDVPEGSRTIFSAHGVAPEVWEKASARSLKVTDATCPLVTKVHQEAVRYAQKGYTIILVGHEGHDEVIGTLGEAPSQIELVTTVEDVKALDVEDPNKLAYITQTTLSLQDTQEILGALREKFPAIEGPPSEDICYATQNRQEAVLELARQSDLVLVVGAHNSSNSIRMVEEAEREGTSAYLINDLESIQEEWLVDVQILGLTSGASAPERLVQKIATFFQEQGAVLEELILRHEDVHFSLPPNLQNDMEERGRKSSL